MSQIAGNCSFEPSSPVGTSQRKQSHSTCSLHADVQKLTECHSASYVNSAHHLEPNTEKCKDRGVPRTTSFERSFQYDTSIFSLRLAPPRSPHGEGHWSEPVQCFTEQWALVIANLKHQESHAVIKVVRYGLNIQCFADAHAVELVEKQIAQQK